LDPESRDAWHDRVEQWFRTHEFSSRPSGVER
jgi:hypothetical protein